MRLIELCADSKVPTDQTLKITIVTLERESDANTCHGIKLPCSADRWRYVGVARKQDGNVAFVVAKEL